MRYRSLSKHTFFLCVACIVTALWMSGCSGDSPPPTASAESQELNKEGDPMEETHAQHRGNEHHPLPPAEERAELPADGGPDYNRLIHETSPYLLLHADNPVDWYPWGKAAFEEARERDLPIFLSVGYSTCHWCHVMARESFTNHQIAHLLNEHFVPVKVDREERPDVDSYYMTATNLLTQRGGWPNSVWLTPEGEPFYAGTYYPPRAFKQVLEQLAQRWNQSRDEVVQLAERVSEAVEEVSTTGGARGGGGELTRSLITQAVHELESRFDSARGGFGGAPKFPPHGALRLLLHEYRRRNEDRLLKMTVRTLEGIALGGIRDHLGGGFHRYSTDARWLLPHFEKMLYDNAQLARAYAEAYDLTGDELYRRVAEETCNWVLDEMRDEHGGFYSALSSESEGEEGKYYVWGKQEIVDVLGAETGERFCTVYGVKEEGNYREESSGERTGKNVLHLEQRIAKTAGDMGVPAGELREQMRQARDRMLEARQKRVRPDLDDKVLASWNGLMIAGLAAVGRHLEEPRYTRAAREAADFVLSTMRQDGRLLHVYREGDVSVTGFLEDYAYMADGLLALHRATGEGRWLEEARALADVLLDDYYDSAAGGFYTTMEGQGELSVRMKDPTDGAVPSGNAVAAEVMLQLAKLTREERYAEAAGQTLRTFTGMMRQTPRGTHGLILATAMHLKRAGEKGTAEEADRRASGEKVQAEISGPDTSVKPGAEFTVQVRIDVEDGWHINSNAPLQEYLIPTELSLGKAPFFTLDQAEYPSGSRVSLGFSDEELSVYEGQLTIQATLQVSPEAPEGSVDLPLTVRVQPCNDAQCLRPQQLSLRLPVEVRSGD